MESSSTSQLRSTSLPSRFNPSFSQIEINLTKLKTLVPFNSSMRIHGGVACLIDLYVLVDELVCSSQTQRVNLQSINKALVEDALTTSTRLMDSYGNLVELLAQMKQNVRVLQFALRRDSIGTRASSESHLLDYFLSQKKVKKNIVACLRSLERLEREIVSYIVADKDHHLSTVIGVFRQIVIATISMFRYVLLFLSGKQKLDKGFSLVKKLVQTGKRSGHKSHEIVNDADTIDVTLDSSCKHIKKNECKRVEVQMVMRDYKNLIAQSRITS